MLDRLRDRAEDFLASLARERYRLSVLQLREAGLEPLYARFGEIFESERISEVQRALAEATGQEEKRLRHLLEFLVHQRAASSAAVELNESSTRRNLASVAVGETRVPLPKVPQALAEAPDAAFRGALAEAWLEALDAEEPLLESLLGTQRGAVEEVGYGSYVATCEFLSGTDLRALARSGASFLTATEGVYRELLAWFLPRVAAVEASGASMADAWRLRRAQPFDVLFQDPDPLRHAMRALGAAGLDIRAGGRLRVESHPELMVPTGVVSYALAVPDDVVIAVLDRPRPGRPTAAATLFHLGGALHRAHTSPDLPFEHRWLGDESVPRAFALMLQALLATPSWLTRVHRASRADAQEQLRFTALLELMRARREVGQLRFELALHEASDLRSGTADYAEALAGATGLAHDRRYALASVEPGFRVARRLRAEQLAAVLSTELRERFDEDWFRNPRADAFLTGLFASGQEFAAPELCVQLTSRPLSFDPLIRRLVELAG